MHTISIKNTSKCKSKQLSKADKEKVAFVVNKFGNKPALELEGVTTLDYVARSLENEGAVDESKIVEGVKRIKGTKFSDEQLYQYVDVLRKFGYLS